MNEVLKNIKSRRSTRTFKSESIAQEDLMAILEAGTYAPSGMNYQTWHFTAVKNTELLNELNIRMRNAFAKSYDPRYQ